MDYNPRMSLQQFRTNSQMPSTKQRGANGNNKQRKDDGDEFIRLSDREIADCITDMSVPFEVEELMHPQPQKVQKVFELFGELLMNTTRETVEPAMRAAAKDICGEELQDIVPVETQNLMGFYASMRKLLVECGISDFSISDLYRPTHSRLSKIFSYLINFVRFRESHIDLVDHHFNTLSSTKVRIENLYLENSDMSTHLSTLRSERAALLAKASAATQRNADVKAHLLDLKAEQERTAIEVERLKGRKAALVVALKERTERAVALRQDSEKLRPYASQSTVALQAQLAELSSSLERDRAAVLALERRARALATSTDTFTLAANDVAPCVALLGALSSELAAEEGESAEAARRREGLGERSNEVRDVEREEQLLLGQLRKWGERTDGLRAGAERKKEETGERMRELREEHRRVVGERGELGREVERRKVRIEQTEKKMADLKENIENEVQASRDEYLKMEAHIKLYISEMEQAIAA